MPTSQYIPPSNNEELVLAWIQRTRESQFAHYDQATRLRRASIRLGIPVMVITAIIGTTVFSSISQTATSDSAKMLVGLFSVLASILSSLQTFMKLPERSEQHRAYGARYGGIRRKLEQIYAARENQEITTQLLDSLNCELNALAEEAPDVPTKATKKFKATTASVQSVEMTTKN